MKTIIFALCILGLYSYTLNTKTLPDNTKTYTSFEKNMVIHYYHGGGMHYSSQNIYIRYDSCVRVDMLQGKDMIRKFAMTDELRKRALEILVQTKATSIKSNSDNGFAHDKATTSVCVEINKQKDFCASSGSSSEINDDCKVNFSDLCRLLGEFSNQSNTTVKPKPGKKVRNKK
jgi:hypothetical protein